MNPLWVLVVRSVSPASSREQIHSGGEELKRAHVHPKTLFYLAAISVKQSSFVPESGADFGNRPFCDHLHCLLCLVCLQEMITRNDYVNWLCEWLREMATCESWFTCDAASRMLWSSRLEVAGSWWSLQPPRWVNQRELAINDGWNRLDHRKIESRKVT